MELFETTTLLKESYSFIEEQYGFNPVKGGVRIYKEDNAFNAFVDSLSQGLSPRDEVVFKKLANNLRIAILQEANFSTNYTAYNQLLLPLLRIFFPRLVAKEAVTVDPLEKPFDIKYFIKAVAKTVGGSVVELPDYSGTLSSGPMIPTTTAITVSGGIGSGNLVALAGLASGSLQRDVMIISVTDGTDNVAVNVYPDNLTGVANITVTYPTSGHTDELIVNIDFSTGNVEIISKGGYTTGVYFSGTIAMETNENLTEVEFKLEPYQISAISRKLNIKWSIEFEQDVKALFDIDAQAQLLNLLGAQIATDIDKEIITDLITAASISAQTDSFSKTPPAGFAFGPKQWYENILPKINALAGVIYQKTAIAPGNTIICNPLDAAILQSTGEYSKTGDLTGGELVGTIPYKIGELSNSYKVLVSQLVPQGKMLILLNPVEPTAAVYAYMPYIPVTIYPWPMVNIPSLSYMTRYAKRLFRPNGIALLNITA